MVVFKFYSKIFERWLWSLSGCNGTQTHNHLVRKRTLTHLAKLASDLASASSKEFLDIQATIECGFTLKCVLDMIKTYSHDSEVFHLLGLCNLWLSLPKKLTPSQNLPEYFAYIVRNDINDIALVSLLLILNRFHTLFWCSIVVGVINAGWVYFTTFQKL